MSQRQCNECKKILNEGEYITDEINREGVRVNIQYHCQECFIKLMGWEE